MEVTRCFLLSSWSVKFMSNHSPTLFSRSAKGSNARVKPCPTELYAMSYLVHRTQYITMGIVGFLSTPGVTSHVSPTPSTVLVCWYEYRYWFTGITPVIHLDSTMHRYQLSLLLKRSRVFLSNISNSHGQHVGLPERRHAFQFSTLLVGEERAAAIQKLSSFGGPFTWIEVCVHVDVLFQH